MTINIRNKQKANLKVLGLSVECTRYLLCRYKEEIELLRKSQILTPSPCSSVTTLPDPSRNLEVCIQEEEVKFFQNKAGPRESLHAKQ